MRPSRDYFTGLHSNVWAGVRSAASLPDIAAMPAQLARLRVELEDAEPKDRRGRA